MITNKNISILYVLALTSCAIKAQEASDDSFLSFYMHHQHQKQNSASNTDTPKFVSKSSTNNQTDFFDVVVQDMGTGSSKKESQTARQTKSSFLKPTATAVDINDSGIVTQPPMFDPLYEDEYDGYQYELEKPFSRHRRRYKTTDGCCKKKVRIRECPSRVKRVQLARPYNFVVLDGDVQKHWVIPLPFYFAFSDVAYNNCNMKIPLSQFIFGSVPSESGGIVVPGSNTTASLALGFAANREVVNFHIRDVFLLSKLSELGLLNLNQHTPVPNTDFGNHSLFADTVDQQFLAYLAPVEVSLGASESQLSGSIGLFYRMRLTECSPVLATFGFTLPIIDIRHRMDVKLIGNKMYQFGFAEKAAVREDVLKQFYKLFTDIPTFFELAVLRPKGLSLLTHQNRFGIGDFSMTAIFDFADSFDHLDALQLGLNFIFPTAKKAQGNTIWEIELGNGGFGFEFFGTINFNIDSNWVNPTMYLGGSFVAPFTSNGPLARIPRIVTNPVYQPDVNVPGLVVPIYREYWALPFSLPDTTVPYFADLKTSARVNRGATGFFGLGNYFYNVFRSCFRLGIFYDLFVKQQDCIRAACPGNIQFLSSPMACCRCTSFKNRVGWNLTYRFEDFCWQSNAVELAVGSQFVVGGRNAVKTNELFVQLTAVF